MTGADFPPTNLEELLFRLMLARIKHQRREVELARVKVTDRWITAKFLVNINLWVEVKTRLPRGAYDVGKLAAEIVDVLDDDA